MTLNEIVSLLAAKGIPVTAGEDNDGQVVLYTNRKLDADDETLIPFDGE